MHPFHFTGSVSFSASYLLSPLAINVFNLELYLFVFSFLCRFCVVFVFLGSRWSFVGVPFLSSRPRAELATTYVTGYGRGPIG